ncbi:MAG: hypothetical protein R3176_05450 [Woeseiaceae bacterium]|nr:hypothetical protein [Woeseiaceae bacterium]
MDKFAERLRDDAARIDVTVAPELEARIRASLEATERAAGAPERERKASLPRWWATTLTGAALAAAVIVALNLRPGSTVEPAIESGVPDLAAVDLPRVPLRVEPAVLTSPLEEEYAHLKSDLEKAEKAVREQLDSVF